MFPNLNPMELLIVFGVAVLLFGKRLPEVGRSLGRGIMEFKKGIKGVEEEFRSVTEIARRDPDPLTYHPAESVQPAVPKFEAPSASPVPTMEYEPHHARD